MSHGAIAVFDLGKTNAKLALVDPASLDEIAVETRPNRILPGPPWPHVDLEGHWAFFLDALARFGRTHRIGGISVATHGAAAVLLDRAGGLAAPMLDYEHDGPDALATAYDAIRPSFARTGSPRLPGGLNLGAQLHWMFAQDPGLAERCARILTYPQYWSWRLTGIHATDVTSLGCHTDLWDPWEGRFSPLVDRLGIAGKLPAARRPGEVLGTLLPGVAGRTGLAADIPVACGIHDSNASLYPYLLERTPPFAVVSTGTWVIAMAVGAGRAPLDPGRDTLVNVDARGHPVPSARFMGGREHAAIGGGRTTPPGPADRRAVLAGPVMLLPSVVPGSGPFQGRSHRWTAEPATDGARGYALALYLALMTRTCLDLAHASGPVIVEGPFTRNADYLEMLAALCDDDVLAAAASTGTGAGSALLLLDRAPSRAARRIVPRRAAVLRRYAASWHDMIPTAPWS